jgi:hypothetical protein
MECHQGNVKIDLSNLEAGVYFLKAEGEKGIGNARVLKK